MPTAKLKSKHKRKQVTHFIVTNPGVSSVAFGTVISITYAKDVMLFTKYNSHEQRVKVVPYTRNLHKQLRKNPKIAANLTTQIL